MRMFNIFKVLISNFNKKFRISIRNPHTGIELWHIFISPLNMFVASISLLIIAFVAVITTVIYTPILDMIPGYPGNKSRELLIRNIIRLDSLESEIKMWNTYRNNISLILDGKTPMSVTASKSADSVISSQKNAIAKSKEDSIFRLKTNREMAALPIDKTTYVKAFELNTPVRGVVAKRYNISENINGIYVYAIGKKPITSITDGAVISNSWSPDKGNVIYVQHAGNMISVYENLSETTKKVGQRVKSGEILGFVGVESDRDNTQNTDDKESQSLFYFELWDNGYAVDPENYILF